MRQNLYCLGYFTGGTSLPYAPAQSGKPEARQLDWSYFFHSGTRVELSLLLNLVIMRKTKDDWAWTNSFPCPWTGYGFMSSPLNQISFLFFNCKRVPQIKSSYFPQSSFFSVWPCLSFGFVSFSYPSSSLISGGQAANEFTVLPDFIQGKHYSFTNCKKNPPYSFSFTP